MAWELRGDTLFYYRSRKIDGRVVKEYCGSGAEAALAALEDEHRRRARRERDARLQQAREATQAADAAHQQLNRVTDGLLAAALGDAGYHRHDRGHWRKRRA